MQKNTGIPFVDQKKRIFIITNLNILYIILLSTIFWTWVYNICHYRANYKLRFVAQNQRANVKNVMSPVMQNTIALW